ncbi:hypothetical protein PF003_g27982 [Phytophthora fragariae]|nr:hypothetical protein PF003_g27982 [Phytophthora fragariae]
MSSESDEESVLRSGSDDDEAFLLLLHSAQKAPIKRKRGGSEPGKAANLDRAFQAAHLRLWKDYFCENPTYPEKLFRRRNRMSRALFERLMGAVVEHDADFEHAAVRMLVCGCAAGSLDDVVKGAESTLLAYTKKFYRAVVEVFEEEYLREPTCDDIERQLERSAALGFPGCLGSLDCMYWAWEMCPIALKGQLKSNNDINIINRSALIHHHGLKHDLYDSFAYVAGEKEFHQLYYLVDGIYPSYACFMATIFRPSSQKGKLYAKRQESIRKDVERTFGVLRGKFRILKLPSRIWYGEEMLDVMKACVIIHNMIIEDKWGVPGLEELTPANIDADLSPPSGVDDDGVNGDDATDLQEFITRRFNMQSAAANSELRNALIENLWELGEHERIYVSSASTCLRQLAQDDDGDDDKEEKRDGCRADQVEINEAESSSAPSEDRTHPRLAPPPPALPTAQDPNESGKSAEDRVEDAQELYEKLYEGHCDFLEAWRVLRVEPKWKELPDASGGTSIRKRSSSRSSLTQSVRQGPANESRAVGVKRQKQQRTLEESNGRIADAAVVMAKSPQRKAQLEEKRLALLREREQNRIIFASLDGLDKVSLNIIRLKKENILRELQQVSTI